MNYDYWEPPEAATRSTILSGFNRHANNRMLSSGKRIGNETVGQARACILIERFVNQTVRSSAPAYVFRPVVAMHETNIGSRLRQMISLLGFFDSCHDYSEHLCAFLYSCWTIESMFGLNLKEISHPDYYPDEMTAEALNLIAERIRMCAAEEWFQRAPYDRRYEAQAKSNNVAQLTAQILRYYARTMIVRVDLGYQLSVRKGLTIDDVYGHLDYLKREFERHPVFHGLVGYAWNFEQGERQGFHIHSSLYFDGSKEYRHIHKGFEVEAIWKSIVGDGGKVHICNAHLDAYDEDEIGIGLIDRMDDQACLNAIAHIPYIAKDTDTQYLRIKPKGRRTYGSSLRPDLERKRGRPASHEPTWEYP